MTRLARTSALHAGAVGLLLLCGSAGCLEPETTPGTCYSPDQNLSIAYDEGAVGCACDAAVDEDVCATFLADDGRDHDVALLCDDGRWFAVEDGPCMP